MDAARCLQAGARGTPRPGKFYAVLQRLPRGLQNLHSLELGRRSSPEIRVFRTWIGGGAHRAKRLPSVARVRIAVE
jgi:hypothetical protein